MQVMMRMMRKQSAVAVQMMMTTIMSPRTAVTMMLEMTHLQHQSLAGSQPESPQAK